ncbi:FitA-like ribbon-helix-helix domain-containing protein [Sphingomonas sp. GlSt437]|uniref:FitA-like ribbon-helix-helix domain-containing protein n=1 Tax=Sphingomonas sp. GlSt437 TaxID=3389970 RepID=UPI003A89408D
MAQLLIRQLDDRDIERLRARAKAQRTSVEALAREAIRKEAQLTVDEKLALVRELQAETEQLKVPGVEQTPGWKLIREDRDAR